MTMNEYYTVQLWIPAKKYFIFHMYLKEIEKRLVGSYWPTTGRASAPV